MSLREREQTGDAADQAGHLHLQGAGDGEGHRASGQTGSSSL